MKTPCGELLTQPANPSSGGEAEDERSEADALHRAANGEFQARASAGWSGLVHAGILPESTLDSKPKRRAVPLAVMNWCVIVRI